MLYHLVPLIGLRNRSLCIKQVDVLNSEQFLSLKCVFFFNVYSLNSSGFCI